MADEIKLSAESRTEFGKGAARRLRRDRKVPAVVYGHGKDPLHITLHSHATMLALKHRNAVVGLEVDGANHLAYAKMIQRHPVRGHIEHVDFVSLRRGEKIQVEIPVAAVGSGQSDVVITVEQQMITIAGDALSLPDGVEVDVNGFAIGTTVLAKDLPLPKGVELITEPDAVVVQAVQARRAVSEDEADTESEDIAGL